MKLITLRTLIRTQPRRAAAAILQATDGAVTPRQARLWAQKNIEALNELLVLSEPWRPQP